MRRLLLSAPVIVGVAWGSLVPATASPLVVSGGGLNSLNVEAAPVEEIGYWRRQYRRYGYPVPYAYAYGYYAPPPGYAYYPPAYDSYAPPPAPPNGAYSSGEADYGDYPPATGDDGDYPPPNGY